MSRYPPSRDRRGYTLVLTVLALVALGGIVLFLDLLARTTNAVPKTLRQTAKMDGAAVAAVGNTLDFWPRVMRVMAPGSVQGNTWTVAGIDVAVLVYREDQSTYRIEATATAQNMQSVRRLRAFRRRIALPWQAAVVTTGTVLVQNGQTVRGIDTPPANGVDCAAPLADAPGFFLNNTAQVRAGWASTYEGSAPQVVTNSALTAASTLDYGEIDVPALASLATIAYAPGSVVGPGQVSSGGPAWSAQLGAPTCNNWGNPDAADGCETHYPIIWARGALTVTGGRGQGVLIADGPLIFQGDAHFTGLVIVRAGGMTINGTANVAGVTGMVVLYNDPFQLVSGRVTYSSCAVQRVNNGRALSRPVPQAQLVDLLLGRDNR